MEEVAASQDIDRAMVSRTTEADIARYIREDGEEPDAPDPAIPRLPSIPSVIRGATGLSDRALADAIGVPEATWRDWEQPDANLDPAVRALLTLLADDPQRALRVLRDRAEQAGDAGRATR